MSKAETVDQLRQKIDSVDDRIHDLLMERAELVARIAEVKKRAKLPAVIPAREARIIGRRLSRHGGVFPAQSVIRIWREIVGAAAVLQPALSAAVYTSEDMPEYWDMARDYFGGTMPVKRVTSVMSALGMARENEVTFAVLPWPEDGEESPWWPFMIDSEGRNPLRVVQRFPFGNPPNGRAHVFPALVVGRTAFEASESDRTLIVLDLDNGISRTRILEKARAAGLEPVSVFSASGQSSRHGRALHLLEVGGYAAPDSPALSALAESFDDHEARCICIGGFPLAPEYPYTGAVSRERGEAAKS